MASLLCQYRYDPLDRLINQTRPGIPVHQRFYCKSRLTTEIQGALQYSIVQSDDLLLAQQQRQGVEVSNTLFATDQQRSVLQTRKANQQQHTAYSPYGHPAISGLLSLLGFNGERPDPLTGHYLLGHGYRAFNPALMRFNSPDSLSPFGKGGLNPYAYCQGDPINQRDPTGNSILFRWSFDLTDVLFSPLEFRSGPEAIFDVHQTTVTHTFKKGWKTYNTGGEQWREITKTSAFPPNRKGENWSTTTSTRNSANREIYYKKLTTDGNFTIEEIITPVSKHFSKFSSEASSQKLIYSPISAKPLDEFHRTYALPKIDIEKLNLRVPPTNNDNILKRIRSN